MLYFDCPTGISGDMTVAALLDLGASQTRLDAALRSLKLPGVAWRFEPHRFVTETPHHHAGDHHAHRNLTRIREIIERGALTARARAIALRIFEVVADAEAKAHHCAIEEVHFHEVGADDSILDAVATGVLVDDLGESQATFSILREGTGHIRCAHGELELPVPAVREIVAKYGLPLEQTDEPTELVTPTGAAIAAALRTAPMLQRLPSDWLASGYGEGTKKLVSGPNRLTVYRLP